MSLPILAPEAITPDWLTEVLRRGGVEARVAGFTQKRVGTGQIGQSVRFDLTYDHAPPGAPRSLVGKFPAPEPESRNAGIILGNYEREVEFYRHLAPSALIATPKCYFTDMDVESGDFVLMMEDLAPAEQGDQLKGCSVAQTRLAVLEAANLHASHWGDEGIEDLAWVSGTHAAANRPGATGGGADPNALAALWGAFCDRYQARLAPDMRAVGEAFVAHYDRYEASYQGPKSLVHIDYRPDNMMFASPAGGRAITVLDWQSLAFGCGVTDVAYFMAGALPPETRRTVERDLLGQYHARLAEHGVAYDFDDLWRDYRSRAFALFLVAFYAAMLVTQTTRGDDMFFAMIRGSVDMVNDLGSMEFLG